MTIEQKLIRLYHWTRYAVALIWLWTALVSWFFYPQAESIDWLRRLGLSYATQTLLLLACLFDAAMGVCTIFFVSKYLWRLQIVVVILYSLAIAIALPAFFLHPFGPLIKNIAVIACLAFLSLIENEKLKCQRI
jgi:hypothetical protein